MIIFLNNLRFHAFHGVLAQERSTGNDYLVTVRASYPDETAVRTDRVSDTLNYAAMYDAIAQEMRRPQNLVEHVAGRIGERLFHDFPKIAEMDITVVKQNPPMGAQCDGAGVELHLINGKSEAKMPQK